MLSICIPSYNRHDHALDTALSLLDQITLDSVKLVVIDNFSDINYQTHFEQNSKALSYIESGLLTVYRNFANIGMSANFMRCFEIGDSEWLWMVSDDDNPRSDAVETVLNAIREFGTRAGCIKFRSGLYDDVDVCNTFDKFVDYNSRSKDNFNSSIFISNSIYKRCDFNKYVGIGYHYAYTYIPHFMMVSYYVYDGGTIVNINNVVVDYVVPEIGYSYSMVAGLGVGSPKNIILDVPSDIYSKYQSIFFPHNDFKVIIDLYYYCESRANSYVASYLANEYFNYVSPYRSFGTKIVLFSLKSLIGNKTVFEFCLRVLCKFSKTAELHIAEMKVRYRIGENT